MRKEENGFASRNLLLGGRDFGCGTSCMDGDGGGKSGYGRGSGIAAAAGNMPW